MTTRKKKDFCFSSILGNKIIKQSQDKYSHVSTNNHLRDKIVGLYFSSSWCPPCRTFTPALIKFYKEYHLEHNFEIILIPYHETNDTEYYNYFKKMPWYSYSHTDISSITQLVKYYKCVSVPSLIFIDNNGQVIHRIIDYQEREKIIINPWLLPFFKKQNNSVSKKSKKKIS